VEDSPRRLWGGEDCGRVGCKQGKVTAMLGCIGGGTYRRRAAWFAGAERVLLEHGAGCVHDLPPQAIGELARRAEAVWKEAAAAPAAG
jgi:hypothetical protein